jgi:hypothetical protein
VFVDWKRSIQGFSFGVFAGGGAVAAYFIYSSDTTLPSFEFPAEIDSGWGSLIGAFFAGVVAVALFLWQRRVDKNQIRAAARGRAEVGIALCLARFANLKRFMNHRAVAEGLTNWLSADNFEYRPEDRQEVLDALAAVVVVLENGLSDLREVCRIIDNLSSDHEVHQLFDGWVGMSTQMEFVTRGLQRTLDTVKVERDGSFSLEEASVLVSREAASFLRGMRVVDETCQALVEIRKRIT